MSFSALPVRRRSARSAPRRSGRRVRIPIPTSGSSIRGSSFARTTPRRSTSERPTSARAPARPSGRSCPTSWTSPTTGPAASWAAPTSPSIRADRAARMRFRPTAGRCGAWPPRPGACCSSWHPRGFGVPVDQLAVSDGVISVAADPSRKVTYGELIGGKRFNVTLTGNNIDATTGVGQGEDGAGAQDRRPVAAALRHSRQGGRLAEVGRRRQAARHGARAQREAAGRRREARQHRRVVRSRHPGIRQGREQGQLRRRRLRAGRAGDSGGPAAQGQLAEAGDRAVPDIGGSVHVHARRDAHVERARRRWWAIPTRRWQARRRSSRPTTRSRSRDTRRSVRRTPWPIRRTIR